MRQKGDLSCESREEWSRVRNLPGKEEGGETGRRPPAAETPGPCPPALHLGLPARVQAPVRLAGAPREAAGIRAHTDVKKSEKNASRRRIMERSRSWKREAQQLSEVTRRHHTLPGHGVGEWGCATSTLRLFLHEQRYKDPGSQVVRVASLNNTEKHEEENPLLIFWCLSLECSSQGDTCTHARTRVTYVRLSALRLSDSASRREHLGSH